MNIYFGASVTGRKIHDANYRRIVEVIRELGHTPLTYNFFQTSEEKVRNQTLKQKMAVHEELGNLKRACDIAVFECSFRSFGVGQEIAHAFRIGKPVLALYSGAESPHFILSDAGDRLLVSEYTLTNLKQKIAAGLAYLNPHETKRFTMNIPASIVDYLDRIAREKKLSRSDYLRNLILADMHYKRSKKT